MTTGGTATDGLSTHEHRAQLRRAVIASTIGTTIEWYDFFIYGTVTGLVFPKLYFPESDPLVGTLQAFAIYAVVFLTVVAAQNSSSSHACTGKTRTHFQCCTHGWDVRAGTGSACHVRCVVSCQRDRDARTSK